jgi:hypothetical protein
MYGGQCWFLTPSAVDGNVCCVCGVHVWNRERKEQGEQAAQAHSPVSSGITVLSWPEYSINRGREVDSTLLVLVPLLAAAAAAAAAGAAAASMFESRVSNRRPMLRRSTSWPCSSTNAGQTNAANSSVACGERSMHVGVVARLSRDRASACKRWRAPSLLAQFPCTAHSAHQALHFASHLFCQAWRQRLAMSCK